MFRRYQSLILIVTLTSFIFSFIGVGEGNVHAEPAVASARPLTTNNEAGLTRADYGKMPLIFEQNRGQTDETAKFIARGPGYKLHLADGEAVFSLKVPGVKSEVTNLRSDAAKVHVKSDVLRMRFAGANSDSRIVGTDAAVTRTNYYTGKKRYENISNFHRVRYSGLYAGVDAVFYGNQNNQLEYDFEVEPNGDVDQITLNFDGARTLAVDAAGNLVIKTENTELIQRKPVAFQEIDGEKKEIAVSYRVDDQRKTSSVKFSVGEYDKSRMLVIDPVLTYLTYIGGSSFDTIDGGAVDAAGNILISGSTSSTDFPSPNSRTDEGIAVFVAKLNSTGSSLLYVTFLDGAGLDGIVAFVFGENTGTDVAVDAAGNAYITGVTTSGDFPTTSGAYQTRKSIGCIPITLTCVTNSNEEAFVTKLDATGQISYSTYLGGRQQDAGNAIAVDSSGRAYVTGVTNSGLTFPKKNEFQGTGVFGVGLDSFLTVFNAAGSDIIYSSGLGGNSSDAGIAVAVDPANKAYITGSTGSAGSFPTKNEFQSANGGGTDAFIAKFDPFLSGDESLIYSTFLGGSGTDKGFGIAVSSSGQAHVTGITGSSNFPLKNAIDSQNQINEAFVTVYDSNGSQLHSTFLGGTGQEEGRSIAVGKGGTIYVTGFTQSDNFLVATPFQITRNGQSDAFVTKLRLGGISPGVSSSSFLGGNSSDSGIDIAVQGAHIFVLGNTTSNNLATVSPDPLGPVKAVSNDTGGEGFAAKILDTRKETIGTFNPTNTVFGLRNTLNSGPADITVDRGAAGDVGVAGDFNGDGVDTVSTFNNGVWRILNFNVITGYPTPVSPVNFGQAGDRPIVGDWDGDGTEGLGTYRPSTGQFFLSNSSTAPAINFQITFGIAEDLPIAGDWDGDGRDSVGVFRPSTGQFFLTNDNVKVASIDVTAFFGTNGDLPVGGDWDGDGKDSIGVWRPSTTEFFLSNDNSAIANLFFFGAAGDGPVVGDWDGKPNQ